jgi:hypothetical protein
LYELLLTKSASFVIKYPDAVVPAALLPKQQGGSKINNQKRIFGARNEA